MHGEESAQAAWDKEGDSPEGHTVQCPVAPPARAADISKAGWITQTGSLRSSAPTSVLLRAVPSARRYNPKGGSPRGVRLGAPSTTGV